MLIKLALEKQTDFSLPLLLRTSTNHSWCTEPSAKGVTPHRPGGLVQRLPHPESPLIKACLSSWRDRSGQHSQYQEAISRRTAHCQHFRICVRRNSIFALHIAETDSYENNLCGFLEGHPWTCPVVLRQW